MTNKVKIKAIIKQYADKGERLLEEAYENGEHASTTGYWDGYGDCANLLLRELDDMQEEPVSDDFEVEVKKLWMEINTGHSYSIVDSYNIFYGLCMDIAEWQKQKDANLIFNAKEDGYRLGFATMKQQMMAKAVDATVHIDAGGYPYIPQMELYDYDKDIPLAKEGEKVKVIVIKE